METGKAIKDFNTYRIYEDGTIRNIRNRVLKPDKNGCVSIIENNRRKTLSIVRLVAITFLGMPDDKQHTAYKKDPKAGYEVSNIAWDSLAVLNKERLTKARENKTTYTKELKQEQQQELKQETKQQELKQETKQQELKQETKQQELKQEQQQELTQELKQEQQQELKQEQQQELKQEQQQETKQQELKQQQEVKELVKQELIETIKQQLTQEMEHLQFQHNLLVEEVGLIKQAMIDYNKQVKELKEIKH